MTKVTSLRRALEAISDHWSWLIVKEAYLGTTRFQDFQDRLKVPRQTLIQRLKRLTDEALFYKKPVFDRRLLFEYRLTAKGIDLYPVVLSVWRWHRIWHLDPTLLPEHLYHTKCGQPVVPQLVCAGCGEEPVVGSIAIRDVVDRETGPLPEQARRTRIANEMASLGDAHLATVVLGDGWNMLIMDAVTQGVRRFHELQGHLGISSNVLAARLKPLVHLGLLEYSVDERDRRIKNYRFTEKGRDIYPIVLTLTAWGDRWLVGSEGPPQVFTHTPCGQFAEYRMICGSCRQRLEVNEISWTPREIP